MERKELVINLLVEEYKFSQMVRGMEVLGFTFDRWLGISTVVASLLGLKEEDMTDEWVDRYTDYSRQSVDKEYWHLESLMSLAEEAYESLVN